MHVLLVVTFVWAVVLVPFALCCGAFLKGGFNPQPLTRDMVVGRFQLAESTL